MDGKGVKMEKIIKKINEFSKIAKERKLTEEEAKEREKYRKLYINLLYGWKIYPYN